MDQKENRSNQEERLLNNRDYLLIGKISLLLSFLSMALLRAGFFRDFPTILLPLFSIIAIIIFYSIFYKQHSNVKLFTLLVLTLTVIFPLVHFGLYKVNPKNYVFEKSYLENKSESFLSDTSSKLPLLVLNSITKGITNRNLQVKDLFNGNLFFFDKYIVRYSIVRNPDGFYRSLIVYQKSGEFIGGIQISDETMELVSFFQNEINSIQEIKKKASNPSKYAYLNEFWIESITAFAFGQIKTNTYLAYFFQIIQTIVASLVFTMIINSLNLKGLLQMGRKK